MPTYMESLERMLFSKGVVFAIVLFLELCDAAYSKDPVQRQRTACMFQEELFQEGFMPWFQLGCEWHG